MGIGGGEVRDRTTRAPLFLPQEAGLFFGNYWSQEVVRIASWLAGGALGNASMAAWYSSTSSSSSSSYSSSSSSDWGSSYAGAELLLGVNDAATAAFLQLNVAAWQGASTPATANAAFTSWAAARIASGAPVAAGVFEWVPSAMQRTTYDHIV